MTGRNLCTRACPAYPYSQPATHRHPISTCTHMHARPHTRAHAARTHLRAHTHTRSRTPTYTYTHTHINLTHTSLSLTHTNTQRGACPSQQRFRKAPGSEPRDWIRRAGGEARPRVPIGCAHGGIAAGERDALGPRGVCACVTVCACVFVCVSVRGWRGTPVNPYWRRAWPNCSRRERCLGTPRWVVCACVTVCACGVFVCACFCAPACLSVRPSACVRVFTTSSAVKDSPENRHISTRTHPHPHPHTGAHICTQQDVETVQVHLRERHSAVYLQRVRDTSSAVKKDLEENTHTHIHTHSLSYTLTNSTHAHAHTRIQIRTRTHPHSGCGENSRAPSRATLCRVPAEGPRHTVRRQGGPQRRMPGSNRSGPCGPVPVL